MLVRVCLCRADGSVVQMAVLGSPYQEVEMPIDLPTGTILKTLRVETSEPVPDTAAMNARIAEAEEKLRRVGEIVSDYVPLPDESDDVEDGA